MARFLFDLLNFSSLFNFGAVSLGLFCHPFHQFRTRDRIEPWVVFDLFCQKRVAANVLLLKNDRVQLVPLAVDRRCQPRRASSNDDDIVKPVVAWRFDCQQFGQLCVVRINVNAIVDDDRRDDSLSVVQFFNFPIGPFVGLNIDVLKSHVVVLKKALCSPAIRTPIGSHQDDSL